MWANFILCSGRHCAVSHVACCGNPWPRLPKGPSHFLSVRGLCRGGLRWLLLGSCVLSLFRHHYQVHVSKSLRPNCTFSLCLGFLVLFHFSIIFVHVPAKHDGWVYHVQLFFFFFFLSYMLVIRQAKMGSVTLK